MAESKMVNVLGPTSSEDLLASMSQAINNFGMRLYQGLAKTDSNFFFSPFSISTILAMLHRGADGDTAQEMQSALFKPAYVKDLSKLHGDIRDLLEMLGQNAEHVLSIANAVLSQTGFPFLQDFKDDVVNFYAAVAREVNFNNPAPVVVEINDWVKEKTKGMIETLFDSLAPNTVMVLLNAVYFKGTWKMRFDSKNTKPLPFYNRGVDLKKVPMMYLKSKFRHFKNDLFQAVELPYKGEDTSMVVILPLERDGLKIVENAVSASETVIPEDSYRKVEIRLTMPKLRMEYEKLLNESITDLGMALMFSEEEADFGRLTKCPGVFVSQIKHKAVLEVNEEGTEAAAVTGAVLKLRSMPMNRNIDFTVDHPFLFFIMDKKRDLILFAGRVEEL